MIEIPILKTGVRSLVLALLAFGAVGCVTTCPPSLPGWYGTVVGKSKRDLPIAYGEKGSILVVFRGAKMPPTNWSVDSSPHPPAEEEFKVIPPPPNHEEYAVTNFAASEHLLYFIDPKNRHRDPKKARGVFAPEPTKIGVDPDRTTVVEIEYLWKPKRH